MLCLYMLILTLLQLKQQQQQLLLQCGYEKLIIYYYCPFGEPVISVSGFCRDMKMKISHLDFHKKIVICEKKK